MSLCVTLRTLDGGRYERHTLDMELTVWKADDMDIAGSLQYASNEACVRWIAFQASLNNLISCGSWQPVGDGVYC